MKDKIQFKNNIQQYGMIFVMFVIIILFQRFTGGLLLTPVNVTNIILQNSYILILSIGMLLVIITGNVDLSVGSMVGFIGALAAVLMISKKLPMSVVILICIIIGAGIGAWNGYWIAYKKIPSFIVTLSSLLLFRGLAIFVLDGKSIGPFPLNFQKISSSFLPDIFSGSKIHITTLIIGVIAFGIIALVNMLSIRDQKKHGFTLNKTSITMKMTFPIAAVLVMTLFFALYNGFPTVMIIMVALVLLYSFFTNKAVIGRRLYAVGGNEGAARLSGINTKKYTFYTFVNMGVIAAMAALVFASRLNAGTPRAGAGFELDALAACYIGGASATGGSGKVAGAILGCFIIGIMNNGMSLMGIATDIQQAIKGLVILFAVAFDFYARSKQQGN